MYTQRHILRRLERIWTLLEGSIDRLTSTRHEDPSQRSQFNPLYYVDTLGIFLLLLLLLTGTYLTVVYRPGAASAYASLELVSSTWFGSLMRTVHRYASDGLLIVVLIHAIKIFLSDRFWGSRWLAWVSGMVLLIMTLVIGVMGYFLIWDRPAQWLAEYFMDFLSGPIVLTFASPQDVSEAFGFFVIILFLHVFLSLVMIAGLLIHELRLSRGRLWSPRWLMIGATVIYIGFALWRPVVSEPAADLTHLIQRTKIDVGYMGFLAISSQLGQKNVWAISLLIIGGLTALPWLLRGKQPGPARVIADECTGCSICFQECPYTAITMMTRPEPDAKYPSLAVIDPVLCTGCGLCVGDCPPNCIELETVSAKALAAEMETPISGGDSMPFAVYACERHHTLGTIPESEDVIATYVPCIGMVQAKWVRSRLDARARAAVLVGCATYDCAYREGPTWMTDRVTRGRNRALLGKEIFFWEMSPGDQRGFRARLSALPETGQGVAPSRGRRHMLSMTSGLVFLLLTLALSLLMIWPVRAIDTDQGMLRLTINHSAKVKTALTQVTDDVQQRLPEGVSPEQFLGGERYPVALRLEVDGEVTDVWTYEPSGLRNEGSAFGLEELWFDPGSYHIRLEMIDDGQDWREVLNTMIEIRTGQIVIATYDDTSDRFIVHEQPLPSDN